MSTRKISGYQKSCDHCHLQPCDWSLLKAFRRRSDDVMLLWPNRRLRLHRVTRPLLGCWREGCRAPAKTARFVCPEQAPVFIGDVPSGSRNHPPDIGNLESEHFRQTVVQAVKSSPSNLMKRTYDDAVLEADGIIPQFHATESTSKRAR